MLETRVLHEVEIDFSGRVVDADVRALCVAFAELMERAVDAVQWQRLDQDDVLLERLAVLRDPADAEPREWTVTLPGISSPESWLPAFDLCRRASGVGPCRPESTEFVRLKMVALREIGIPLPALDGSR
jgi:hypothetical protein